MLKKIILVSDSTGRLKESFRFFADLNIEVLPQLQPDAPKYPEPYHTFVESVLVKALHAARRSGLPALVDNSGTCIAALNGASGVLSAHYAGVNPKSDTINNKYLSDDSTDKADKNYYYVCVLVSVRYENDS